MDADELVVAGVLGGAAMLLAEIRFEHREVLGETWAAWIPLAYAALLLLAGGLALLRFRRGGREVLRALFAAGLAIGALGIWFHSGGHPARKTARAKAPWGRCGPDRPAPGKAGEVAPLRMTPRGWGPRPARRPARARSVRARRAPAIGAITRAPRRSASTRTAPVRIEA